MLTGTQQRRNPKQFSRPQPQLQIETTTIREFTGGLNVADNDLNMKAEYAKVLDNIERSLDGSLSSRPGTRFHADVNGWADASAIVNITYFNAYIIAVQASGAVTKTDGAGVTTQMLIGGANPWTATTTVDFTIANSDLLIMNGVDKPLIIAGKPTDPNYMTLQWLVDIGTASNVNTPIGKFCCAFGQYVIIAGIVNKATTISISSRGTSGTYFGDPPPNDGVEIDLGPRVTRGSATITGLAAFRDKLIVTFQEGVLLLNLGVYAGSPAVHTPTDDGFIEEFGCLSYRSISVIGDDAFFIDSTNINGIQRITTFSSIRPKKVSQLIDPALMELLTPLTLTQMEQKIFAVHDSRNYRYMVFIPRYVGGSVVESECYSLTYIPARQISEWAHLVGWNFTCSCRTTLKNIFFGRDTKLYYYDFDNADTVTLDRIDDPAVNSGDGEEIDFVWELPWADFNKRINVKESVSLALDTRGTATFLVEMFTDNSPYRESGAPTPELSMTFVGGETGGYGNTPFGTTPYGGGRRSADERIFAWPSRFKIAKLKFSGTLSTPIKFISVSLAYMRGSIRR